MTLASAIPDISLGPTPTLGVICQPHTRTWQPAFAKFDNCSVSRSRDMIAAPKNLNGSRHTTTPPSGVVCHPWATTCCHYPI